MRRLLLVALVLVAAGCGTQPGRHGVRGKAVVHCQAGSFQRLGGPRVAYAAIADRGAVAYESPGGAVRARFGPENVNGFPTVFGVLGKVVDAHCRAQWMLVQLPIKPNGARGYVRASSLELAPVHARIVVDISERRLTVYRNGRPVLTFPVAVGSPGTPTPTGRYYVNQRLIPDDPNGPFGPEAIGISAFSNVLTGWVQGGPVAIHGTNEPWSIGHAVSNGCIRLPNAVLERVYPLALAGTPVLVRA